MRKFLKIIAIASATFLTSTSVALAQGNSFLPFRTGEKVILEKDEVVTRDFFAAGELVEIRGTVNGDLYTAGGNVIVDGTVLGDVLAAGGTVEVNGKVRGDVRVAGGTIKVNNAIGKSLTAFGGTIDIDDEATIGGSSVFGAGNVTLGGPVGGDVIGGIGNLRVGNIIGGNIYATVGTLTIDKSGGVKGNVLYWSEQEAQVDSEATISGTLERKEPPQRPQPTKNEINSAVSGFRFFSFLSMLFIGLLIIRLFPGVLDSGTNMLEKKPWQSLGFGFLALILVPIIAVLLMISVIGFPLGIILFVFYFASLYFSSYFVAYWVGRLLLSKFNQKLNPYLAFLIGTIVFALISSIPFIAGFVRFLSLLFGLGALLLLKWSWYDQNFRTKKS